MTEAPRVREIRALLNSQRPDRFILNDIRALLGCEGERCHLEDGHDGDHSPGPRPVTNASARDVPRTFWDDLNEDLKDPEFRRVYEETFTWLWHGLLRRDSCPWCRLERE